MLRLVIPLLIVLSWWACAGSEETPVAETDRPVPTCNFQMQTVQNLPETKFKVVGGRRTCENGQPTTMEILLFAPGEPIDNHKQCNVFATTDTHAVWQLLLGHNRIDVVFETQPQEGTVTLQQETVYDSIEVVYGMLEQPNL